MSINRNRAKRDSDLQNKPGSPRPDSRRCMMPSTHSSTCGEAADTSLSLCQIGKGYHHTKQYVDLNILLFRQLGLTGWFSGIHSGAKQSKLGLGDRQVCMREHTCQEAIRDGSTFLYLQEAALGGKNDRPNLCATFTRSLRSNMLSAKAPEVASSSLKVVLKCTYICGTTV